MITTTQLIGLAAGAFGALVGVIFGLVRYINSRNDKAIDQLAQSITKGFDSFGKRIDKLTEKMDMRHEMVWQKLGALEMQMSILSERDARRMKDMEDLKSEMDRRLQGMHSKVNEVAKHSADLQAMVRRAGEVP